jgi:hypothetical protein
VGWSTEEKGYVILLLKADREALSMVKKLGMLDLS